MRLHGVVDDSTPILFASVAHGRLRLGSRGPTRLVLDTGFTGTLALPESLARRLTSELIAIDTFVLATGDPVDLPVYSGTVQVGMQRLTTWFTIGEGLVGTELLRQLCSHVQIDFDAAAVELLLR